MPKVKTNRFAMATSAALLITGCASQTPQEQSTVTVKQKPKPNRGNDSGQCHGVNSCKGSSSCASVNNSCAKQNTCRGKGWLSLDREDCEQRGGQFQRSET